MNNESHSKNLIIAANQNIKEKKFWLDTLSGDIARTNFPYDYNTKNKPNFQKIPFRFPPGVFPKLMELCNRSDHALNIILAAGLVGLLHKYTGRDDILIGSPIYKQEIEEDFINTLLVLRNDLSRDLEFKELIIQVSQTVTEATENYSYPLGLLGEQLDVPFSGEDEHHPLFDVIYLLENIHDPSYLRDVRVNMTFSFRRTGDTLEGWVQYNSHLYEKQTVERIVSHFNSLMEAAVSDIRVKLSRIGILSVDEKRLLLQNFNDTALEYPGDMTLHQLFEEQAETMPLHPALVFEGREIAYRTLNEDANRLASLLRAKGVQRESVVGLLLDRSPRMVTAILAVLKAGGAYLPLEPGTPSDRILSMLNDGGVSILLTESRIIEDYSFTTLQDLEQVNVVPRLTAPRPPIPDMGLLPIPDRSLVNYKEYHKYIGLAPVKHTVSLQTSRGCPYKCLYCHKIWPKKQIARSAEDVFEEIKRCYEAGVRRFAFVDDIFNLRIKNSSRLLKMIIENHMGLQLFFPNGVRGDILTEEFIDLMMEAGTVDMLMALETASPRMQKLVKKNMNLERFEKNLQYIINNYPYVNLEMNIMIGFPTETEEEALAALDFLKRQKWIHFPNMHLLKVYPNTDMYCLALENGVSEEAITQSIKLGYHELPETLPFSKGFARKYQTKFLNEYFLLKERLLYVLPYQMKIFSEDELIQKYDSYLPITIKSFDDLLEFLKITREELGDVEFFQDEKMAAPGFRENYAKFYPPQKKDKDALRILFLDLSLLFSRESEGELYSVVEPPLGLMYLLTYLNEKFPGRIVGKVIKSQVDFDNFQKLKEIIDEFKPELLCLRTLSYYKDFFHTAVSLIREWGIDVPLITGGPYASSDYPTVLQDKNVDLVVLGEGEYTLAQLVEMMLANGKQFPCQKKLQQVQGIAYIDESDKPRLAAGSREILQLDYLAEQIQTYREDNLKNINSSADLCYVIFTSGSTGKPKGTLTSHKNVIRVVKNTNYVDITPDDRLLQLSNYAFDGSVFDIYGALLNGATLVLVKKADILAIDRLSQLIAREGITIFFVTTALFNTLVDLDIESLKGIKKLLFGGERVSVDHTRRAFDYLGKEHVLHMYGPTETTVYATCNIIREIDETLGTVSIGTPLSNTLVYILDKNVEPVPVGVPGEMYVGGDGVSRGYMNNPVLTMEKFIPNPFIPGERIYRTGDLARWLPGGEIEFLERIDRQVKIRGFRIELGEIESRLIAHKDIKEALVVALPAGIDGDEPGNTLCAYIVPQNPIETFEIRDFIARQLPAFMIPAHFVQLEKMPLTSAGKIDKKTLPKPEVESSETGKKPRTDIEKRLASVWEDVLAVENIGINDNFFEIGGDSIKVIQVSSRLVRQGLEIETSDFFSHPTIEELGRFVKESGRTVSQETVSGDIPLTPIQEWFSRIDFDQIHHFNQSVMLFKPGRFKEDILKEVFLALVKHHDALRMVYETGQSGIVQTNRGIEGDLFNLEIFDFTSGDHVEQRITAECSRIQQEFRLDSGPLVKSALFKTREGDHLLMVIHHFVIDGVSWRILFEDFEAVYYQLENGKNVDLPPKTDSFKTWAERLKSYAESPKVLKDLQYWQMLFPGGSSPVLLPKDFEIGEDKKKRKYIKYINMNLNEEETRLLLRNVNRAYNTEINDILLTALGLAVKEWSGCEDVAVALEGHGRENILDNVDVSRTVGWFTSLYPVLFNVGEPDLAHQIVSVKETLRRLPNKGIGYGILKYLAPGSQENRNRRLELETEPEISFNYLGQFEQVDINRFAGLSPVPRGDDFSPEFPQVYSIEVNGNLVEGKLNMFFSYNPYEYRAERIEILVENYKQLLVEIIRHCNQKKDRQMTPSDYGCSDLSLTDVQGVSRYVATEVGETLEIQHIYRLAPMQAGMLYHSLRTKSTTAYFEQFELTLRGQLDAALLEESFNILVARYDILRTIFVMENLTEPMQVVFTRRDIPLNYIDISHLPPAHMPPYIENFKKEDKKKGFDLAKDILLRNTLFKTNQDSYKLIWSIHHILMDGWCVGIIYNELIRIYSALKKQTQPQLPPAVPYHRYIGWLEKQDKADGLSFWNEYLDGYEKQAVLPRASRDIETHEFELEEYQFTLDEEMSGKIKRLVRENRVTENTLFQAVWVILLQIYNNTQDVAFGAVVSGRPSGIDGIENMVGLFINTIPVRIKIDRHSTFLQLLKNVYENAVHSKPYEYIPLADIQAESALKADLIDHIIAFENYPLHEEMKSAEGREGPGFTIESLEAADHTNYNFHISIGPGYYFWARICFNSFVYDRAFVEKVVMHFQEVIKQVVDNHDVLLKDIPITHDYLSAGAGMAPDEDDWLLE